LTTAATSLFSTSTTSATDGFVRPQPVSDERETEKPAERDTVGASLPARPGPLSVPLQTYRRMHRRDRVRDLVCEHDAVTAPAAATSSWILSLLRPALAVALMLAVMWILEIVDVPLGGELDQYGIRPRRIGGLDGVLFAPFLHSGFGT
jgi:hypothetical protein